MNNIVFLGLPGAGKGTQAKKLATQKNYIHISTGDIFRAELKNNTPLGQKAKEYMDKGQLVPDELVVDMVLKKITELKDAPGCILDGFPRNLSQAKAMEGKIPVEACIYFDLAKEEVIKRLSSRRTCRECGFMTPDATVCEKCNGEMYQREDDKQEVIAKRLDVYDSETSPLIDYYNNQGLLKKLDGSVGMENVYKDLLNALGIE